MILCDPVRRPSRLRGVLAALLLATLGLPAWPRQAPDADSLPVALVVPDDRPSPPTTEPDAGGAEPDAPLIRSDVRSFRVPFAISDAAREQVDEVCLYVSVDRGRTWSAADAAPPGRGAFQFRTDHDGEHWFAVRVRDRDGRLTPPETEALQPGLRVLVETAPAPDATDRIPILDPPAGGDDGPCCLDPPTEAEVLAKLPPPGPGVKRSDFRIVTEKIGEKVDPPKLYPLAGRCELVHCHYKCTVSFDERRRSDDPIPSSTHNGRVEVVYLDKDYLRRAEAEVATENGDRRADLEALLTTALTPSFDADPAVSRQVAATFFGPDHWSAAPDALAFRLAGGWLFARTGRADAEGAVILEPIALVWQGKPNEPHDSFAARRGRVGRRPVIGPEPTRGNPSFLVLEGITGAAQGSMHDPDRLDFRVNWDPVQFVLSPGSNAFSPQPIEPEDGRRASFASVIDPPPSRAARGGNVDSSNDATGQAAGVVTSSPEAEILAAPVDVAPGRDGEAGFLAISREQGFRERPEAAAPAPDAGWPTWRVLELGPLTSGGGNIRVDGARLITKSDRFEVLGDGSRVRLERFNLFGGEPVDEGDGVDFSLSSERATLVFDRPVVFSEPGPRRLTQVIGEGDLRLFVGDRETGDVTTLRSSGVVTLRFTPGSDRPLVEFRRRASRTTVPPRTGDPSNRSGPPPRRSCPAPPRATLNRDGPEIQTGEASFPLPATEEGDD